MNTNELLTVSNEAVIFYRTINRFIHFFKTPSYLLFLLSSLLSPTCGKLLHTLGITIHILWKKLFFIPLEQVVENSLLL